MGIIKQELYDQQTRSAASAFSILGHPGRIKIIQLLQDRGCLTLGEIQHQIGLSQSATSDQVGKLKETGLIAGVPVDTSVYYNLNLQQWEEICEKIHDFLGDLNATN